MTNVNYWNKPYFEGLKEIGEAHLNRPDYHQFGDYCLLKEKGLKKHANVASEKFVAELRQKPVQEQRKSAIYLCELTLNRRETHSLINHPIAKFIENILQGWIEDEPDSIIALRWHARFGPYGLREETLKRALFVDPNDQIALDQSVNNTIHNLEFMTHHLDEGFLIGERADADNDLQKLADEIPRLKDSSLKDRMKKEFESYLRLFELWDIYNIIHPEPRFVDWAKSTHNFDWFNL